MSMANKSLDYLWRKMEVVQNNLANVDTPGYKKKDVSFEEVFDKRLRAASQTKSNTQMRSRGRTTLYIPRMIHLQGWMRTMSILMLKKRIWQEPPFIINICCRL